MKKHSGKKIGIIAAAEMMMAGGAAAQLNTTAANQEVRTLANNMAAPVISYQYQAPFNFRRGGFKRGRRKLRHCSFMGPGIRKKKTNKIHRSRLLKRKHARK